MQLNHLNHGVRFVGMLWGCLIEQELFGTRTFRRSTPNKILYACCCVALTADFSSRSLWIFCFKIRPFNFQGCKAKADHCVGSDLRSTANGPFLHHQATRPRTKTHFEFASVPTPCLPDLHSVGRLMNHPNP